MELLKAEEFIVFIFILIKVVIEFKSIFKSFAINYNYILAGP